MRNILFIGIFILFSLLCFLPSPGFADMIYLKNGKQMEGVITAEDDETITVHIGFGKVTLQRENISKIVKYTYEKQVGLKKELGYKYFGQPEIIPQELKDVIGNLKELEGLRDIAAEVKNEKDETNKKISELESQIEESRKKLAAVSRKLSTSRIQDDPGQYNKLIEDFYSLEGKINAGEYERDELKKELPALDTQISEYVSSLNGFRKKFTKEYSKREVGGEQKRVLDIIKEKINDMSEDFTKHTVDYNFSGSGIIVKVLLNDLVPANLILDTGASVVVISKNIADKLNLTFGLNEPEAYVTLADGRKAKANMTFLENVKVGKLEARNIRTAVLEYEEVTTDDGLLGMSFLKNFIVKIDPNGKKIILEEFNP